MTSNESALVSLDLGPDLSGGPEGVDRSLLAHCLSIANPDGWAVEFGVGEGFTLEMISEHLPALGFDSGRGLPADWRPGFSEGAFAYAPPSLPGTTMVVGWFEDTVPGYDWPDNISLVHVDCDLYSSTVTVLENIGPHLKPGAIVCFDEFHGFDDDLSGPVPGEQRAWSEFVAKSGIAYEPIGHGREQAAFRVLA